jgi:hypothetical protein
MRVVGSHNPSDCGVCAVACALDVSYEQAFGFFDFQRRTKFGTTTKDVVKALHRSHLVLATSRKLLRVPMTSWEGLKTVIPAGARVILKLHHQRMGW